MKRFIALILVLSFLVGLEAEATQSQTQECTCKEGEENCPCLAQSEEAAKVEISKWATQKRAARMEERRLRKAMANLKRQLKFLKSRSRGLPMTKRKLLLAKRDVLKKSCLEMRMRIKAAVLKVKQMRRAYKAICKKRVKQLIIKTVQSIRLLKVQVKRLKVKVKTIKAAMRLASKDDKRALLMKLKRLVARVVIFKEKIKAKKIKVSKIRTMIKRQIIVKKKKKIQVLKLKLISIKKRQAVLVKKRTLIVTSLKATSIKAIRIKTFLRRSSSADPHAMKLIRKLKVLMRKAQELKGKLKRTERKLVRVSVFKKSLVERIVVVKQSIVRIHEDDRCLKLQKKLELELKLANKLKMRYEKACQAAATNQHAQSIAKAKEIKRKIMSIQTIIHGLKLKIGRKPRRLPRYIMEQHILKSSIKKQQLRLIKVQQRIDKTQALCDQAKEEEKAKLMNDKEVLTHRHEVIKARLIAEKKAYLLLKLRLQTKCQAQLNKQKALTRGILREIHSKLILSKKISDDLHRSLRLAKREAALRKQAEKLKMAQLSAVSKDLQDKIMAERKAIKVQILRTKEMQIKADKEAKRLQADLEKKAQAMLKKQRTIAKKKLSALKLKLTALQKKHWALKKALSEEKDAQVKEALEKQYKIQKRKIAWYKKQLRLKKGKIMTLNLELKLRRSAITAQQKEMAMKRVLAVKKAKAEETKLLTAWGLEEASELDMALKKLHEEYEVKILKLKKELGKVRSNMKEYKVTMSARYKKDTLNRLDNQREGYLRRVKKLRVRIAKAKKDLALYKIAAAKAHGKKERALKLRLANEAQFQINRMKMKLRLETQKQRAGLKALQSGLNADLAKEQASLNDLVMKIKAKLARLKSEALRKEATLRATLEKAVLNRRELRSQFAYTKEETRNNRRSIQSKKRVVEKKNKKAIVLQGEADKKRIAESQRRLARIKMNALTMEAKLKASLKTAQDEAKQLKRAFEAQQARYKNLNQRYASWKVTQSKKHQAMMKREHSKYLALSVELQTLADNCKMTLQTLRTELSTLEITFKKGVALLVTINDVKKKRAKARELIAVAEKKLHKQEVKLNSAISQRSQLCEIGTPGPALRLLCKKLNEEIIQLQSVAGSFQIEITQTETSFSSH